MRIAYLTGEYARASDTFIRNEVIELRVRGHHVETYSVRHPRDAASPSADVAAERATTCYILSTGKVALALTILGLAVSRPGFFVAGFVKAMRLSPDGVRSRLMHCAYWLEAAFLASRLLRTNIDILHNHIAENSATVALLASRMSGIPFSMTVHGPGIFFQPRHWALKEKIAEAAFTACITNFCKSQCMLHSAMADWPRLKVIRCGVGRAFESATTTPPPDAPRLLFVGRLCAEKGLPLLLQAVVRFIENGGRCSLAIVGDGPLRQYVETFTAAHGLSEVVELLGWRDSAEIVEQLLRSRTLVLPSFAEGLPVVIMEAMALGRPVIATAVAGIPELVEHERNGWLIAAGSVEELTLAIAASLRTTTAEVQEMGRRGADAVRERHTLTIEVAKLEASLAAAVHRYTNVASASSHVVAY